MQELYSKIIRTCPLEKDFAQIYQLYLGTIIALKTPLSPTAIQALLGTETSVSNTLRLLGLAPVLLELSATTVGEHPLQIMHDTFRQFATRHPSSVPASEQPFIINKAARDEDLALRTLLVLNRELPLLASKLDAIMATTEPCDIPRLPQGVVSEVLWYSCRFWIAHLETITTPGAPLMNSLGEFLETHFHYWMILCAAEGGFIGIERITAWCEVRILKVFSFDAFTNAVI